MEDCRERNFGSELGVYVIREVYFVFEGLLVNFFDSYGFECKLENFLNKLIGVNWLVMIVGLV